MNFTLSRSVEILERTPLVLDALLKNIDDQWINETEGEGTWSAFDIVGHLIHGEKTDWIPRAKIILRKNKENRFIEFDRFAQFENSKGKSLISLLEEFTLLRRDNIFLLKSFNLKEEDLILEGIHPEFGVVNLSQLLSTWVVHDLGHIAQISRILAVQYKEDVGPWKAYLGVLK